MKISISALLSTATTAKTVEYINEYRIPEGHTVKSSYSSPIPHTYVFDLSFFSSIGSIRLSASPRSTTIPLQVATVTFSKSFLSVFFHIRCTLDTDIYPMTRFRMSTIGVTSTESVIWRIRWFRITMSYLFDWKKTFENSHESNPSIYLVEPTYPSILWVGKLGKYISNFLWHGCILPSTRFLSMRISSQLIFCTTNLLVLGTRSSLSPCR